eukprot:523085-Prymnesium_polylepis.1
MRQLLKLDVALEVAPTAVAQIEQLQLANAALAAEREELKGEVARWKDAHRKAAERNDDTRKAKVDARKAERER